MRRRVRIILILIPRAGARNEFRIAEFRSGFVRVVLSPQGEKREIADPRTILDSIGAPGLDRFKRRLSLTW